MKRPIILFIIAIFLLSQSFPAYGASLISEYLFELGLKHYEQGKLALALQEFQKALIITPGYESALEYIDIIQEQIAVQQPVSVAPITKPMIEEPYILKPHLKPSIGVALEKKIFPYRPEEEILTPQLRQRLLPSQVQQLEGFIELAIKNNQPAQIAREEIDLAQFKIGEAERNLFPALKLEGYRSEGKAEDLFEYEEREVKIQLDQPVYYGGRLKDSLSQAEVNLEITKRNYDRVRIDVAHKTEVAYYNLVGSRMNLKIQEEIRQEAEEILEIVQKQYAAELVTPLEISNAQSRYEQINFQVDSTKQDMAMAELTFIQVLDVPETPEVTQEELVIKKLDFQLNECLEAGLRNRPEIYLGELLVRFNEYGKRIEESKNKFTVDFTTSYGYYEGAFRTEDLRSSDTWYVGLKATKPWGGSTFNSQILTEDAGPRYGETTRTEAFTITSDFNLLDNLARLSEEKKAGLELRRAVSDLNETTKTINFEIKDAYLNYKKALLQATTAQSETEFRLQEVEVLRVRAQVGETEFSNIMEALVNLSRSQTTYTQALSNYFISLANLKKASGYGIKI